MRKILSFLFLTLIALTLQAHGGVDYAHNDLFKGMQKGDKAAILMVHFGTTHADTRQLTIDVLNQKAQQAFPGIEVREAYTSRIVIKRLGERGTAKLNPNAALTQLKADGYTHILVQASTIIDGVEMESLNRNVQEVRSLFKEVRVGTSLLHAPSHYAEVIKALTADNVTEKAYLWVGHGTYDSSTAQYAMLDYMLKAEGHTNCFVGTVEGYPALADAIKQLKASNLKQVVLLPFMFVAGEHAKNDIAGDWKEALGKEGFAVEVQIKGLGENPKIQDLYISHLKYIATHKKIDIMEKKAIYEKTGTKMGAHTD